MLYGYAACAGDNMSVCHDEVIILNKEPGATPDSPASPSGDATDGCTGRGDGFVERSIAFGCWKCVDVKVGFAGGKYIWWAKRVE